MGAPGVLLLTKMSTLKRGGRLRNSLVRMHSPIKVAILQCSTVGVNITLQKQQHGMQPLLNMGARFLQHCRDHYFAADTWAAALPPDLLDIA